MKKKKKTPMWFEEADELPIEREMNQMIRKVWERPMRLGVRMRMPRVQMRVTRGFPIDMKETKDELLIKADLPGFKKDDVKLKVTSTTVSISAQKRMQKQESGDTFYRQERSMGTMNRAFRLPVEIDSSKVKAKMDNGVLAIILPKVRIKKKKGVDIK